MNARRLLSIDVLRGIAIAAILVIHRIHYQWNGMQTRDLLKDQLHGPWAPLIILTIVLFTMAGMFYFITGIVNAFSLFKGVSGKSGAAGKYLWGGILSGVILILVNYIHRLFFVNGFIANPDGSEPEFPVGLLTGWVRQGNEVVFRWSQLTEPGTLSLIGFIVIFVTITLSILLRDPGKLNFSRINTRLSVLTILFLLASPFMKYWLRPVYEASYQAGNYFGAAGLGHLCQEFCFFPYLGYGFLGAILGLSLARDEDWKTYRKTSRTWIIFLSAIGLLAIFLFNKEDPFGKRMIGAGISYVELAIFILMLNGLLKYFDFCRTEKSAIRWRRSLGLRRFGMVALSVYFFEPFVAELLKAGVDMLAGSGQWTQSFPLVLLFGLFCLAVWWVIVFFWAKVNFFGALETIAGKVVLGLSGKRSTKTNFSAIREYPADPASRE